MDSGWQFSLRALMLAIGALGVLFAFATLPDIVVNYVVLCLSFVMAPAIVVGLVFGSDRLRAFCIGAFMPSFMLAVSCGGAIAHTAFFNRTGNLFAAFDWMARHSFLKVQFLIIFAVAAVLGAVCVIIHQAIANPDKVSRPSHDGRRDKEDGIRLLVQFSGGLMDGCVLMGDTTDATIRGLDGDKRERYELLFAAERDGRILLFAEYVPRPSRLA